MGRKFGGCGVLAFQQLSQLRDRYGDEGAATLTGLCATWVSMRQNDPATATWVAQSFGEAEISEMQQGVSYGAHEIRDGVSITAQRRKRETLLPSQIMSLNDLEGYIRLPGDVPIGHFKIQYKPGNAQAVAFEPRPSGTAPDFTATPDVPSDQPPTHPLSKNAPVPAAPPARPNVVSLEDYKIRNPDPDS